VPDLLFVRRLSVVFVATFVAGGILTSCAGLSRVMGFSEQAAQARATGRIDGRVDTISPGEGPMVVVLANVIEAGGELVGIDTFVRLRPGGFAFSVEPGRYQLGAYEDRNRNGLFDRDERVSTLTSNPAIDVAPGQHVTFDIIIPDITIPDLAESVNVFDLVTRTPQEQRRFSLWAWSIQGDICKDLEQPKFGPEAGPRGLWQMMDFLNDGIAGVYFMEPYDPKRTPILFVHGISGYPQQFTAMIDSIDRTRFQPWFYFYPSGFRLEVLSTHLSTLLERLKVEHDYRRLGVVAHSMGGLVARQALLELADSAGARQSGLFVTIATPFGGDPNANRAERAPVELPPVFLDMRPSSDFLRNLFYRDADGKEPRRLPRGVKADLLFGFNMRRSAPVAGDGTIILASALRREAQAEATSVRGFDYGHVDILDAPEVAAHVNSLLTERFD
jgi:pimeloyl-ACP methyl ester carboxylesterase